MHCFPADFDVIKVNNRGGKDTVISKESSTEKSYELRGKRFLPMVEMTEEKPPGCIKTPEVQDD
jgi:hypothetical protein